MWNSCKSDLANARELDQQERNTTEELKKEVRGEA